MKNHKQIDRQILVSYLKGELPSDEAWEVEKAMQEDPMLAEAMEGLALAMKQGDLSDDLEELDRRILHREESTEDYSRPWILRAAAVIVLLAVSGLVIFGVLQKTRKNTGEIALQKTENQDTSISKSYSDAGKNLPESKSISPVKTNAGAAVTHNEPESTQAAGESEKEQAKKIPVPAPDTGRSGNTVVITSGKENVPASPTIAEMPSQAEATGAEMNKSEPVSDIDSKAVEDNKKRSVNSLSMAASKPSEVSGAAISLASSPAHPLAGDSLYRQYIREHLIYPATAKDKGLEGEVYVRFRVNADSTLSGFSVIKSLGSGCDEEALRLLKNGPRWVPAIQEGKPAGSEEIYKIQFRLKK